MAEIEDRPYSRALYDFRGECPGELNFSAGDLLFLTSKVNGEWLGGECQATGQTGIFPASFVEVVVPLPDEHEVESMMVSANALTGQPTDEDGAVIPVGMASVLYDFEPRFPDELSVRAGDSVQILTLLDAEWAKCRDPTTNRIGIVPQGFLHIFLDALDISEPSGAANLASFSSVPTWQPNNSRSQQLASNLHPPLPQTILAEASSRDWSKPWDDIFESTIPRKTSVPNLAPPPRPPPPRLETNTPSMTRPISLASVGQLNIPESKHFSIFASSLEASKNHGTTVKPSKGSNSSTVTFRRKSLTSAENGRHTSLNWASRGAKATEGLEEAKEADESLISAFPMATPAANNSHHIQLNTSAASQSDAKTKILLDLLNTERTYLFDLETWETCIQESKDLNVEDKKALTNGYPVLKQLSQSLINGLTMQKDLPAGAQTLGEVFMQLRDQFHSAFANHFRCVEQICAIIESEVAEDQSLQRALQSCVHAMRQRGSNCFDVPTAVSRPIQRCLKYPLYVGELLKNTPINHPDHPKLMEALRQQANLASKMNECKRRKELVRKYKSQEQLSLTDRIARINMHSLVKKSNRLKFRINRTMGFGTVKDSEFDYLIQLLEEAERRLCKFLYCAQLYKKHEEMAIKKQEDSYRGVCQVQNEQMVKAFAQMFRQVDDIYKKHMHTFEQEVVSEGKRLVRSELTKLIHKRFDKLADFETAKANSKSQEEVEMRRNEFEALNNQIKAQLPRLISTINKRVLQLIQRVNELDQQFQRRMEQWWERERPEKVRQSAPLAPPFHAHLSLSMKHTLVEMDKIAAYLYQRQGNEAGGISVGMSRKKSLRLSLKAKSGQKSQHNPHQTHRHHPQQRRPQSLKERDALVKICRAQNQRDKLRRVTRNWESGHLVLREGDILWVKSHGPNGFCLCDNAVSTDLVPMELLCPIDALAIEQLQQQAPDSGTPTSANAPIGPYQSSFPASNESKSQPFFFDQLGIGAINPPHYSPSSVNPPPAVTTSSQSSASKREKDQENLIDLEENLIDLTSPTVTEYQRPLSLLSNAGSEPSSGKSQMEETGQNQSKPSTQNQLLLDPFDELFNAAMQLSSSSSCSSRKLTPPVPEIPDRPIATDATTTTTSWILPTFQTNQTSNLVNISEFQMPAATGIQPIRIAPPPPNQKKRTTGKYQTAAGPSLYALPPSLYSLPPPIQQSPAPAPSTTTTTTKTAEQPSSSTNWSPLPLYSVPPPSSAASLYYSMPPAAAQEQFETLAVSIFDFEPNSAGNGQLAIRQGDIVKVLKRNDDAGNDQWWKVKKIQDGSEGFVPANYLSLSLTRV